MGLIAAAGAAGAARELKRSPAPGPPPEDLDLLPRRVSLASRIVDPGLGFTIDAPAPPQLPEGRTVTIPERGEMFVRTVGEDAPGIPVLLLHGWMASAALNWWPVFRPLAEEHPVIAPDHRGHGRGIRGPHTFSLEACADDAAALLDVLGVDRAVVVGYSMGGPIASLMWHRHPEKVAGMVLGATALEWKDDLYEAARWKLMGLLSVLLRWQAGRLLLARIMGQRGDIPAPLAPYRAWIEGEFRRGDPVDLADAGRALGRYDGRVFLGNVDVPVAIVITEKDELVPPHKQRDLAALLGAKTFEIHGDHDTAIVQGEEFGRTMLEAISSLGITRDVTPD